MRRANRGLQGRARHRGMTLVELMMALAVAGILLGAALPGLNHFHDEAAIAAQYETLSSALRRARSEAMTRGELVTACALDGDSLSGGEPRCLPGGKAWGEGWLVFVDRGERGEVGETDRVLAVYQPPANSGVVLGTSRYLSFRASGVLYSAAAHFRFVPPGQPALDAALPGSALICVAKTGRPRLSKDRECR